MTKSEARKLILVLSQMRISFTLTRKDSLFIIAFDMNNRARVARSLGN